MVSVDGGPDVFIKTRDIAHLAPCLFLAAAGTGLCPCIPRWARVGCAGPGLAGFGGAYAGGGGYLWGTGPGSQCQAEGTPSGLWGGACRVALDRTRAGSSAHSQGRDASPACAHGGGCGRSAWRRCPLAQGQQGSVPRTYVVAQQAQPGAPGQLTPTEAPARSTHSRQGARGWVCRTATYTSARADHGACSAAVLPQSPQYSCTGLRLHVAHRAHGSPSAATCPSVPSVGDWGTSGDIAVLGYTGMTGTAPELYWAILEQCQSCGESNTGLY